MNMLKRSNINLLESRLTLAPLPQLPPPTPGGPKIDQKKQLKQYPETKVSWDQIKKRTKTVNFK